MNLSKALKRAVLACTYSLLLQASPAFSGELSSALNMSKCFGERFRYFTGSDTLNTLEQTLQRLHAWALQQAPGMNSLHETLVISQEPKGKKGEKGKGKHGGRGGEGGQGGLGSKGGKGGNGGKGGDADSAPLPTKAILSTDALPDNTILAYQKPQDDATPLVTQDKKEPKTATALECSPQPSDAKGQSEGKEEDLVLTTTFEAEASLLNQEGVIDIKGAIGLGNPGVTSELIAIHCKHLRFRGEELKFKQLHADETIQVRADTTSGTDMHAPSIKIMGTLDAWGLASERLEVQGDLKGVKIKVSDYAKVSGNVHVARSTIKGMVLMGQDSKLTDSVAGTIVVRGWGGSSETVLRLEGKTVVRGDIIFKECNGHLLVGPDAAFEGKVEGAKITRLSRKQ